MTDYTAAVAPDASGTLLRLRVTPRARATRLEGLHGDAARVRVAAPPVNGKANAALLSWLAHALGVRPADLQLVRGERGRDKAVRVDGLQPATVAARLADADRTS
jgi:uncharacterized protein